MNTLEKIELGLIPPAALLAYAAAPLLPDTPSPGHLTLIVSALLLLQSLLRDLAILARRHRAATVGPARAMRCMCVESTVGLTGILLGACLFGLGLGGDVAMSGAGWALAAFLTMVLGFAIKDFVLHTKPLRIVRDRDHVNIVVSWRQ